MRSQRELRILIPRAVTADRPPEEACVVMETELAALARDIDAARESARRLTSSGHGPRRDRQRRPAVGEPVTLACGRVVVIRPIEPHDARELVWVFNRLGALSRLRRFLVPIESLSQRQVEYLTRIDHTTHEALIALDAQTGEGLGVARYVCDPHDPRRARFAAAVTDAWQGRGLGTELLQRLAARADANDVATLHGSTAAGNRAARHLGASTTLDRRTGTLELTIVSSAHRESPDAWDPHRGPGLRRLPSPVREPAQASADL